MTMPPSSCSASASTVLETPLPGTWNVGSRPPVAVRRVMYFAAEFVVGAEAAADEDFPVGLDPDRLHGAAHARSDIKRHIQRSVRMEAGETPRETAADQDFPVGLHRDGIDVVVGDGGGVERSVQTAVRMKAGDAGLPRDGGTTDEDFPVRLDRDGAGISARCGRGKRGVHAAIQVQAGDGGFVQAVDRGKVAREQDAARGVPGERVNRRTRTGSDVECRIERAGSHRQRRERDAADGISVSADQGGESRDRPLRDGDADLGFGNPGEQGWHVSGEFEGGEFGEIGAQHPDHRARFRRPRGDAADRRPHGRGGREQLRVIFRRASRHRGEASAEQDFPVAQSFDGADRTGGTDGRIEGGVRFSIGMQDGDPLRESRVDGSEIASDEDPSVGQRDERMDGGTDVREEIRVRRAIIRQPGEILAGRAVEVGKRACHQQSPVRIGLDFIHRRTGA